MLLLAFLTGCTETTETTPYDEDTTEVGLIVAYEDGAEPFTGTIGPTSIDTWGLYNTNISALFAGTGIATPFPDTLDEMTAMGTIEDANYTAERIIELADEHLAVEPEAGVVTYRALWLDGYLEVDGEADTSILGVSISGTSVIAMFKPVIDSTSDLEPVAAYSEQAVILHEVGHALGLVNSGVEMVTDHQDTDNGHHCTADQCVMYYANEGTADLVEFIQQYVTTGDEVIFDDLCVDDIQGALGTDTGS
ncbi:MAG: putative Zn-dependent protease [Myxococcota bacterium]|jgi:predicted Zn-dependent protease